MKSFKSLIFFTSLMVLFLSACSSGDDSSSNNNNNDDFDDGSSDSNTSYPIIDDVQHIDFNQSKDGKILTFKWKPISNGSLEIEGENEKPIYANNVNLLTIKSSNITNVDNVAGEAVDTHDGNIVHYDVKDLLQETKCTYQNIISDKIEYQCINIHDVDGAHSFSDGSIYFSKTGKSYIYLNVIDGKLVDNKHNIVDKNTIKRSNVLLIFSDYNATSRLFKITDSQASKFEP